MMPSLLRDVCLVALGGAVGSVARWGVAHVLPTGSFGHWPTFAVNVLGALLLGLLLEALTRPGPETPRAHTVRLLVGTGALGGVTTYSTFAQELWDGVSSGATGPALGYAGLTLVSGLLAAALGMILGARVRGPGGARAAEQALDTTAGDTRTGAPAASATASPTTPGGLPAGADEQPPAGSSSTGPASSGEHR
ncbi:camphor resistance protein CrcB [Kocuria tytonicola]|nr:camphor resistance protein CrcB [Kocuria tytonicola]